MKFGREAAGVVAALLVAAAIAATLLVGVGTLGTLFSDDTTFASAFELTIWMWPIAFVVALAHAVVLGVPAYLLLRWLCRIRWWVAPLCGFAVGALPYAIVFFPLQPAASFSQLGDKVMVRDGVTTLAGWLGYAEMGGALGLLGAAGGFAAWLTWIWLGRALGSPPTMPPAAPAPPP